LKCIDEESGRRNLKIDVEEEELSLETSSYEKSFELRLAVAGGF